MIRRSVLLLLPALLVACAQTPSPPQLAGEWTPQSAQLAGQNFPVGNFGGATLNLTASSYEFAGDKGSYSLLPGTELPARMDIQGQQGPNAGRLIPAIYRLEDEALTICYQLAPGAARPTEFTSPKGSRILLVRYQRLR